MGTPEQDSPATPENNLLGLGTGNGSKVEHIKITSNYLHGQIQEELEQSTSRFSEDQIQLIKFHGMYQQEDRDVRQARKAASAEKAYTGKRSPNISLTIVSRSWAPSASSLLPPRIVRV